MFDLNEQMKMNDQDSRMEAFVEVLMGQIDSDDEPWRKKGYYICKALQENDANALLIALCGWSADSLAKRALLICDKDKEFYDGPVGGELMVEWDDGTDKTSECTVDPATHEVTGYDPAAFLNATNESAKIKSVELHLELNGEQYIFECTRGAELTDEQKNVAFWYNAEGNSFRQKTVMRYATRTVHISEVRDGDIVLYKGETCKATTDAFMTKTETGKEWNFEVDDSDYIWASELDGAMVEIVESVECDALLPDGAKVEFGCEANLDAFADSMLHDSDTNVANIKYTKDDHVIAMDLMVRGSVSVKFKGKTYRRPSQFPNELRELIANNPNKWDHEAEDLDDEDEELCTYVSENNWFEFIYDVDDEDDSDGIMCEVALAEMGPEDLMQRMIKLCEEVLADVD